MTVPVLLLLYSIGFLGFAVWNRKALVRILSAAGRPAGYFAVISAFGLLLAQALMLGDAIYPYSSWRMYTHPEPSPSTWDFQLVRDSGRRERLSPRRILTEPHPRPMMMRLYVLASRLHEAKKEERPAIEEELSEILLALAHLDARRSSRDPVRRIEALRCNITDIPIRSLPGLDCEEEPIATYSVAWPPRGDARAP